MKRSILFLAAFLCVLPFSSVSIAEVPAESMLVVELEGRVQGATLQLFADMGPVVTKAMRIYSEPSHTLLACLIDTTFKGTLEGKQWIENTAISPAAAVVTTGLPGSVSVQVPARPQDDDRIAVWVYGTWAQIGEKEVLIADGKIGRQAFHFTSFIPRVVSPGIAPYTLIRHCCEGPCGTGCVYCSGAKFTCCIGTVCCAAYRAGFDDDNTVCGWVNCDSCPWW